MIITELYKRIFSSIIILPISIYIIIIGNIYFNIFVTLIYLIILFEWFKMRNKNRLFIPGIFILLLSFFSVLIIRGNTNQELLNFFYILVVCIGSDLGGYCFGKIFKGPKLIKQISPNKTYTGVIGSYSFSLIFIFIFVNYLNRYNLNLKFSDFELIICTIFLSTVSQIGDLIISFFKRKSKIKNTGNIIPGHGGLLDRVDGMIFAYLISNLIFILP